MINSKRKMTFTLCTLFFAICTLSSANTPLQMTVSNSKEFSEALNKVKAGDVIVWKDGIYTDVKLNFTPKSKGNSKSLIVLKAQTPGKVKFSGNSQLLMGGDYLQAEGFLFEGACTLNENEHVLDFKSPDAQEAANHCRITNCAVVNYSLTEASGKSNYYVNLVGSHNEVDHCYFVGKTNKGPTLVVEYKKDKGYVPGSDVAPEAHHHIHHNYFGYRTFSSNGGEQIRVGTSTTSFSHGFNIVEYNYFEDERLEAEVISSKSWNNIYRFNTFYANDGAMVIRHGQKCFVYGNYINGKSGRGESGGLRVINPNNTVFNNYVEDLEGGEKGMKSPITVMSGLLNSELSGYYPADNAIVAYNTVVNSVGIAIKIAVGNTSKGKPLVAPKNVWLVGNTVIGTKGKNSDPVEVADKNATYTLSDNLYTNGTSSEKGFSVVATNKLIEKNGFQFAVHTPDRSVIDSINNRLTIHGFKLSDKEITEFNPNWKLDKKDVGVNFVVKYINYEK